MPTSNKAFLISCCFQHATAQVELPRTWKFSRIVSETLYDSKMHPSFHSSTQNRPTSRVRFPRMTINICIKRTLADVSHAGQLRVRDEIRAILKTVKAFFFYCHGYIKCAVVSTKMCYSYRASDAPAHGSRGAGGGGQRVRSRRR